MDDESCAGLILPPLGEQAPLPIQATAVVNKPFIVPILMRMREARSLQLPSLQSLEDLFETWFCKHAAFCLKRRHGKQGAGRNPKLHADYKPSDAILASCHTDAKHLKSLLSMVKKQFMSERVSGEPWWVSSYVVLKNVP